MLDGQKTTRDDVARPLFEMKNEKSWIIFGWKKRILAEDPFSLLPIWTQEFQENEKTDNDNSPETCLELWPKGERASEKSILV